MNTPAHAVLSLALLQRGERAQLGGWIAIGAIAPDLPNAVFFAYHHFVAGMSTEAIYTALYPMPQWQAVLAPSHSVWLVALVLLIARWRRHAGAAALGLSLALHVLADLFTHGVDAHPHLWPLSSARFISPVSYWDVAAGARWFVPLELAAVLAGAIVAWRGGRQWWRRGLIAGSCVWLTLAYAQGWSLWGTTAS